MSQVAAIGDGARLAGYGLAGVQVVAADDDRAVREAWGRLSPEVACVILTAAAAAALGPRLRAREDLVWVVVPA